MRSRRSIGWLLLLSLTMFVAALAQGDPAPVPLETTLEQWVPLLADDDFGVREAAGRRLVVLGEPALDHLRKVSRESRDLEVRLRAKRIVFDILSALGESRSTGMRFAAVDAGGFWMGSPPNETNRRGDEPAHFVRINRPLLVGLHEVTQAQFQSVMGFQPSFFSSGGADREKVRARDTARFPVEGVTWFDAVEFCNRLSKADALPLYYQLDEVTYRQSNIVAAKVTVKGGPGYRLPTEAEWEYACRAGSGLPYHFGTSNTGKEANLKPGPAVGYGGSPTWPTNDSPVRVGLYPPNAWGLYDTHGNVGEWCWDYYAADYYGKSPAVDPQGPAQGTHRVVRGGSWLVNEGSCRSASRLMVSPDSTGNHLGFRVVRSP